jgi:hypothetical protein
VSSGSVISYLYGSSIWSRGDRAYLYKICAFQKENRLPKPSRSFPDSILSFTPSLHHSVIPHTSLDSICPVHPDIACSCTFSFRKRERKTRKALKYLPLSLVLSALFSFLHPLPSHSFAPPLVSSHSSIILCQPLKQPRCHPPTVAWRPVFVERGIVLHLGIDASAHLDSGLVFRRPLVPTVDRACSGRTAPAVPGCCCTVVSDAGRMGGN